MDNEQVKINEEHLLGAILMDAGVMPALLPILGDDSECFLLAPNKVIYESILNLYKDNKVIDVHSVATYLNEHYPGFIETMTNAYEKVLWLKDTTPYSSDETAVYYAALVRRNSQRRRLASIGHEIIKFADDTQKEVDDVISEGVTHLTNLSSLTQEKEFNLDNTLDSIDDNITRLMKGEEPTDRLYSGFPSLDTQSSGFVFGEVTFVAGRTSVGKSTLVQSFVKYQCVEKEFPTIIFLLEMTETQYLMRMISSISEVPFLDMVQGKTTSSQYEEFQKAKALLKTKPLCIDCQSKTAKQMALNTQKFIHKQKTDKCLVIIDYVQLMEMGKQLSEYENATKAIKAVKNEIAVKLNLPVIIVSQLNRTSERSGKRATIAELRSSGSLEEGAGQILLIHKQPEAEESPTFFNVVPDRKIC